MCRNSLLIAGLSLAAVILGCSRGSSPQSAAPAKTDSAPGVTAADISIASTIERELAADAVTKGAILRVRSENGVVLLAGTVDKEERKQRAEDIAKQTPGVRQVVNYITVGDTRDALGPSAPDVHTRPVMPSDSGISINANKRGGPPRK
jgi:osmotically-inducible protein OsmY